MSKYHEDAYWDKDEFIYFDREFLLKHKFPTVDVLVMSEIGFPEWAAPNINFEKYSIVGSSLKIGEDRDDNEIFIDLNNHKIYCNNSNKLVNSSAKILRDTLKLYAEMIEEMLPINSNAVIQNSISDELITCFQNKLLAIDPLAIEVGSFWCNEINRLFSHEND